MLACPIRNCQSPRTVLSQIAILHRFCSVDTYRPNFFARDTLAWGRGTNHHGRRANAEPFSIAQSSSEIPRPPAAMTTPATRSPSGLHSKPDLQRAGARQAQGVFGTAVNLRKPAVAKSRRHVGWLSTNYGEHTQTQPDNERYRLRVRSGHASIGSPLAFVYCRD